MDHDRIVNKRAQRIARDHGCSVDEVNAALDHHPIELERDTFLKRTLAMELVELDELQAAFRDKALVDRDTSAGVLLIKVAERRATLASKACDMGRSIGVVQRRECHNPHRSPHIICTISEVERLIRSPGQHGREVRAAFVINYLGNPDQDGRPAGPALQV